MRNIDDAVLTKIVLYEIVTRNKMAYSSFSYHFYNFILIINIYPSVLLWNGFQDTFKIICIQKQRTNIVEMGNLGEGNPG